MKKEQFIKQLENVVKVQKTNGNWNYDPYMHGMANGLILAMALAKEEEPQFLNAPKNGYRKTQNMESS